MAISLLVTIEGIDGSGKTTQVQNLVKKLKEFKCDTFSIKLPDYEAESSSLVKMYLKGYFGLNVQEVNPYISSIAYAGDRMANFEKWKNKYYFKNNIIVTDRWSWSNLAYQITKFKNKADKDKFIDWCIDLEFKKLELPEPDLTILLDMKPDICKTLIKERNGEKDIHEDDFEYLDKVYKEYKYLAKKFDWTVVKCYKGDKTRPIENISKDILSKVEELIKTKTKLYGLF